MLVDFTNAALPWKVVTQMKEVGEMKKNSRFDPMASQMFAGCPIDEYRQIMKYVLCLSSFFFNLISVISTASLSSWNQITD